jgi:hypothetical protein
VEYASARRTEIQEQERMLVDMLLRGPMEPDQSEGASLGSSLFSTDMLRVLSEARDSGRSGPRSS